MKASSIKNIAGIFIFILLFGLVCALIQPLYGRVSKSLISSEEKILSNFTELTGLTVNYESLSPSILTGISIKNIHLSLKDEKSEEQKVLNEKTEANTILFVKKAFISYNLLNIIKGDFTNAFSKVTVSDISFDVNQELIESLMQKNDVEEEDSKTSQKKKKNNSKNTAAEESEFNLAKSLAALKKLAFSLPFDVSLKNISASYSSGNDIFKLVLRDLNLKKNNSDNAITSSLNGIVTAKLSVLNGHTIGSKFKIDGNLSSILNGSSAKLVFDEYSRCDFSLRRLENLLIYNDSELILRSVQQINPFNLYASFNTKKGELSANLVLNKLDPFNFIRGSKYSSNIAIFMGSRISGRTDFKFNLNDFTYSWKTDSFINLSKKISKKGQNVSVKASGNNDYITIESLSGEGELASLNFTGGFDIKNLIPEGYLNLNYFALPNENKISGELYIQPQNKGFVGFIPQLSFGRQLFTAIEFTIDQISSSMNFTFDGFDYSHPDYEKPGSIHIDGSLSSSGEQYLQTSAKVDTFFLDSVMRTIFFFTQKETDEDPDIVNTLSPFISSLELYFSTDFKSITFNSPFALFANTLSDRQMLFLSFDGSENAVNVSQFNLIYDTNALVMTAQADISPEDSQIIFSTNMAFNSIPYELNGIYSDNWLNINGSYGLEVAVDFANGFAGSVRLENAPFRFDPLLLSLGINADFDYENNERFSVILNDFSFDELNGFFRTHPKFNLSAALDPNGLIISSINFTDSMNTLSGNGYALLNMHEGLFNNLNVKFDLKNDISQEKIELEGNVTNPLKKEFSGQAMVQDFYFSAEGNIKKFPLGFFVNGQQNDDTVSAQITASGTLENPYVAVNVSGFSYSLGGIPLVATGNFNLMDGIVSLENLDADWDILKLRDTTASFKYSDFEATGVTTLTVNLNSKKMVVPLNISLENLEKDIVNKKTLIPEIFSINFASSKLEGDLLAGKKDELNLMILRTPGKFDFITDEYLGFYGDFSDDGFMHFGVSEDKPLHFNLDGSISDNVINLALANVYVNLAEFNTLFNTEFFSVYSAILEGNLNITGLVTDPNLEGSAVFKDVDINFPIYVPEHAKTSIIPVDFSQDEIVVPETLFTVKDGRFTAGAVVEMDRWSLSGLDVTLKTEKNKDIPVDIKIPLVRIKGHTSLDGKLTLTDSNLDFTGDIGIRNSEISLITTGTGSSFDTGDNSANNSGNAMNINVAINLLVGQKVQIVLNPLIRGLIAPNTPVSFNMDSGSGLWNLKGDVVLRGGELSYLNRNFYLKEGRISLNETQSYFNPYISVRAETREHDENGDPITITVSAIRQNVSNFKATMYSTPAKSETEIYAILGQIAAGDSSNVSNFLLSTVDYGVSVTVIRRLESALRDLFNFDIFSIRTTLLQNTLKQGFNINTGLEKGAFGSNLFDNSTVYIGKYFGSSIYADALMHWSYDDSKANKADATGGLVFHPEVGLELASPFANIRWSFAPDLGEIQQSWASASSITLSWRVSF